MHRFQLVLHVFRRCVMGLLEVKSKKEAKRSKGKTSVCDALNGGVTIFFFSLSLSLSPTFYSKCTLYSNVILKYSVLFVRRFRAPFFEQVVYALGVLVVTSASDVYPLVKRRFRLFD